MKNIIFILLLSFGASLLSAQNILSVDLEPLKIDMEKVNKLDSCQLKDGLWVDQYYGYISLVYYKKGKKDGMARYYLKEQGAPYPHIIEFYENDTFAGPIICLQSNGQLRFTITNIGKNVDFTDDSLYRIFKPSAYQYQGYFRSYDEYGRLESEGWSIFDDDYQIDSWEIGEWIFYSPNGSVKTKKYINVPEK